MGRSSAERTKRELSLLSWLCIGVSEPWSPERFTTRLARGVSIAEPVAVVVAHADDETLWAGSALTRLERARLIHLTDSAPRDMADAARLGFPSRQAYRQARAAELERALTTLGARPERRAYGAPDQEVILNLEETVDRLVDDLSGVDAVLCHPYEGGHPDHDAAALAVRLAVGRLAARTGHRPHIVEFACYHASRGERVMGEFWPDPTRAECTRVLAPAERARLAAALDAHRTQAGVIDGWIPAVERWRAAPVYDFAARPPPGEVLYDGFGWTMTSARWRALAQEAILQWA